LEQRLVELTAAHRALQETQRELELANRRLVEADDSARFALTTYIHDEILGPLDDLMADASRQGHPSLVRQADELDRRVRRLRFDLSAPILQDTAVELRRLVQETLPQIYPGAKQVSVSLDLSGFDGLPEPAPAYGFLIYRFVHGAVGNAFRHAGARHVTVESARRDGLLRVRVSDDGKGFEPAAIDQFMKGGHYFFHDIAIRARQLDGTLRIDSRPGGGTSLEVAVPVLPAGARGEPPAKRRSRAPRSRPRSGGS
jgi:signal transduction histidine kinase